MSDYISGGADDFSDAALEAKAVQTPDAQTPDAVDAETQPQTQETPELEQPVREEPAQDEAGIEESAGESEAAAEQLTEAEQAEQRKWAGKYDSPEQLEKGHTSYRSYADRKIQEQQQELEALRAAVLNDDDEVDEGVAHEPISPNERAQLGELVASNPEAAFQWAAQHAPDTLPDVISATRELHSDVQADRMQANFQAMLVQAQTEQVRAEMQEMMQPIVEQREAEAKAAQWEQAADQFLSSVPQEQFEVLQEDFAEALQEWGDVIEQNPDMASRAMRAAWAEAQVRGSHKLSEGQQALADANRQQKLASQGEVGIPGSAPTPAQVSEEEQILGEMFGSSDGNYAY